MVFFSFWIHLFWLICGMALPFLSGILTGLIQKHKPTTATNVNVGLFTTLFAMVFGLFWPYQIWIWIIISNLALLFMFSFWWKTDESKKWLIWGTYIAINTILNLAVFGIIWWISIVI